MTQEEKQKIIQTIALLNSMILCGESHSNKSESMLTEALEILYRDNN